MIEMTAKRCKKGGGYKSYRVEKQKPWRPEGVLWDWDRCPKQYQLPAAQDDGNTTGAEAGVETERESEQTTWSWVPLQAPPSLRLTANSTF